MLLDRFVKVEQAEGVRDGRSGPTDSRGDVLLRQPELVDQLPEGERLFDRVQVFALEVLDEGQLELVASGDLADDDRDPLEPGELRGAEPPLPGHDLVAVEGLRHEDRQEDAVVGDARGEPFELRLAHVSPGLERVRPDARERDLGRAGVGAALGDQRGEAAPESALAFGMDGHAAPAWTG